MTARFPNLFSPYRIKTLEVRNRIFSTGHDTDLGRHGAPSEDLVAYQSARAKGGAGLIVVQVVGVHETARYTGEVLMGNSDEHLPMFGKLFKAIHDGGAGAFVQLFHPGRELLGRRDGVTQAAYAPSSAPTERFRIAPRALTLAEVEAIIEGYGLAAGRMAEAGADGVEVVASHGYLPSQFMHAGINRRDDRYGGSLENRLRFTRDAVASIRRRVSAEMIVGLRLSGIEYDMAGIDETDMLTICRELRETFDYFNVIAGTSASSSGAQHIVPPMTIDPGYLGPFAGKLKQTIGKPVFVAGRINQPQEAERIIAGGSADLCGMTRAMICDPEMPNKARLGQSEDIRACIACNQACIGHAQLGLSISCIQYPESGREIQYGKRPKAARALKVTVVGGGPGGMKAAAVAAECGHVVTLHERSARLGGQALLAQLLPHRAEFGGIVTNLTREVERAGVTVKTRSEVTGASLEASRPDCVILAAGSNPRLPDLPGGGEDRLVAANDIITGKAKAGGRVVVYDWTADWVGVGVAEKLAAEGAYVRLAVNGPCAAFSIQNYTRDAAIARLFKLGIETTPFMRLFGIEDRTAYFLHTPSQESLVLEDVDTVVAVYPGAPNDALADDCRRLRIPVHLIGDALAPRTAEEAVFEGLKAATEISLGAAS
ncbi:MAG TPA: FAD-dependent oxidoreductase [Dongiaceae bacterium]|jgi:2,4-dienoyl-CoA reductase-like NADH-dependent reductase (Old Yellow Enzyme family)|nr:FAD-dependent oxidoreductase [Dongiaceae bacterium]